MKLCDIKPEDELTVFDKPSTKVRERQGKYIAGNDNFLTIQFEYYRDTILLSDLRQGKSRIFKDKEIIVFTSLN